MGCVLPCLALKRKLGKPFSDFPPGPAELPEERPKPEAPAEKQKTARKPPDPHQAARKRIWRQLLEEELDTGKARKAHGPEFEELRRTRRAWIEARRGTQQGGDREALEALEARAAETELAWDKAAAALLLSSVRPKGSKTAQLDAG